MEHGAERFQSPVRIRVHPCPSVVLNLFLLPLRHPTLMNPRPNPLCLLLAFLLAVPLSAQEPDAGPPAVSADASGRIIIDTRGQRPKSALLYRVVADGTASIRRDRVVTEASVRIFRIQGEGSSFRVGLRGSDKVVAVAGDSLDSWAVRQEADGTRLLELAVKDPELDDHRFSVRLESDPFAAIPAMLELGHWSPGGKATASFQSVLALSFAAGTTGRVTAAEGFLPVHDPDGKAGAPRYQTTTGGKLVVQVKRPGFDPAPIEIENASLRGELDPSGRAVGFVLRGRVRVAEPGAVLTALSGKAALTEAPQGPGRLALGEAEGEPVLRLVYPEAGSFPLELAFVASVAEEGPWRRLDFAVGSSAVTPYAIAGLGVGAEFSSAAGELAPEPSEGEWVGFLPAGGRTRLAWKPGRPAGADAPGEGKLFFTSTALVESRLGSGLLSQDHLVGYRVLQGKIDRLVLDLAGEGEVVAVEGAGLTAWKVVDGEGGTRRLEVSLGRPLEGEAALTVRTQTPLAAFPVKVAAVRLTPQGAIRHAGHLRLSNLGSVRLEPAATEGLAQLSPEQYPGEAIEARQVFVYRFPSSDYGLEISADRVQPEVGVSQLVVHEISESERRLSADLELDIREAPIREWVVEFPEDYSLVSASGAALADFLVAGEAVGGRRRLTLLFGGEVSGRQLASLVLEKSEPAVAVSWPLPRLEFPEAKSVRGDIGVAAAHGFRVAVEGSDGLVEKPLSYFPKPTSRLQQAFRIREPGWSATMRVEPLEQSVSADVFHLYSLSEGAARASVVINYFVTGAPVAEWQIAAPADLANLSVEGQNVRTWRREGDTLVVSLHQPAIGPSTLLATFEESISGAGGTLAAGRVAPLGVSDERGYVEIVSPGQVRLAVAEASPELLALDPLELPAEFRLLAAAPSLGVWQYTGRPFALSFDVGWFEPGTTVPQAVEFAEADTRVAEDGEAVTDLLYYVKSRTRSALDLRLPEGARLWSVSVGGATVNARQDGEITRIPLPGSADPDSAVEVRLRLGSAAPGSARFSLALPRVDAPVLKTEWKLAGEEKRALLPVGGTVAPPRPARPDTGFAAVLKKGLGALAAVLALALAGVFLTHSPRSPGRLLGLAALAAAAIVAAVAAVSSARHREEPAPLRVSLPLLPAGEPVELELESVPSWRANLSWPGALLLVGGIAVLVAGRRGGAASLEHAALLPGLGTGAAIGGLLWQRASEPWFFGLLAALLVLAWLWPRARAAWRDRPRPSARGPRAGGVGEATALLAAGSFLFLASSQAQLAAPASSAARSLVQRAELRQGETKLRVAAEAVFAGKPGDTFLLLRGPGVLTAFEGPGLRLSREPAADAVADGPAYFVTLAGPPRSDTAVSPDDDPFAAADASLASEAEIEVRATFSYEVAAPDPAGGVELPVGPAAFAEVEVRHDRAGWEFASSAVVRSSPLPKAKPEESGAVLLLAPGARATLTLRPKSRDVEAEETRFYVEGEQLFVPGPGVLDGTHRFRIRPARGRVSALDLRVPAGMTVSEVSGPIGTWQFDADAGALAVAVEPPQTEPFELLVTTERGLGALPAELAVAPVRIEGAAGEVGLAGLAFGPDAQPENASATGMSEVNSGDFDASLLPGEDHLLHRVYRYGAEEATATVKVNPVAPEVRVTSRQILSFGEERIVLSVELGVLITRAGLFQLGFALPEGFEVESLGGAALRHWAELDGEGGREVVLHLNGRTLGEHSFSVVLAATTPTEGAEWTVPNLLLHEASRQAGELVVRPDAGIRLRATQRSNLSELDPRELGGNARDALAFRLLQRDWSLVLGVERLEPWITGQILHSTTLREGQTRHALTALLRIENAAIRELRLRLPGLGEEEAKTLRASGPAVGDLVRVAPGSDEWDLRFQRRVIGEARVHLEFERRGEREGGTEPLVPAEFPKVRQPAYFFALRPAGRLELSAPDLPDGWQASEWTAVPAPLREAGGDRSAPAITLRANSPQQPASILAKRHSLAEALKLRVAGGRLTTLLSPAGDELTSVELSVEVVQRGSLSVGLPGGGELFHLFVNGESVHFVREGGAWRFFILPGADDRSAEVRFSYVVPASASGARPGRVDLASPALGAPVENLVWDVLLPPGMELTHEDGDFVARASEQLRPFDRECYLAASRTLREDQNRRATALLDQASALIQSGDQTRARQALSSVANGFAIDPASNEDARVQLENLRTQQAVVGLNTRRQRLVLDRESGEGDDLASEQIKQGAASNRILSEGELNFRPEELPQLLQGNSGEDNASLQRIAGRIVRQQEDSEAPPRPMGLVLPTEGTALRFERALSVAEGAPLALEIGFAPQARLPWWRILLGVGLLGFLASFLSARLVKGSN